MTAAAPWSVYAKMTIQGPMMRMATWNTLRQQGNTLNSASCKVRDLHSQKQAVLKANSAAQILIWVPPEQHLDLNKCYPQSKWLVLQPAVLLVQFLFLWLCETITVHHHWNHLESLYNTREVYCEPWHMIKGCKASREIPKQVFTLWAPPTVPLSQAHRVIHESYNVTISLSAQWSKVMWFFQK